jgi:Fur family peroxide stress response transcriptional regulator
MKDFTNILRKHNLKATPQRLAIIKTINNYGHINIDKLYEEVKNQFNSISLATIYKNINSMIDQSLLLEVKLPNNKSVYEIVKKKHSHLLCKNCNEIIDVCLDTNSLEKEIINSYKFEISQTDLVISGVCQNCNSKIAS